MTDTYGGYIRTNWRGSSQTLRTDALVGKNMWHSAASIWGGNGFDRVYPLVWFSVSGTATNAGKTVNAYSIMSAYFGSTIAQNVGEGYRILPIGIYPRLLVVSDSLGYLWFSMCTSDDSAITFVAGTGSITTCSFSYDIVMCGFIISAPA